MKIILIAGCILCPYGARFNLDGTEYLCSKLMKINNNPKTPLPECPLDDAVEKIKELISK